MTTPERTANTEAELVQWFGEHMLVKLRENTHKGHWSTLRPQVLLDGLRVEVGELADAVSIESPEAIVRECADVANFAAMLAAVMYSQGAALPAYPGGVDAMRADVLRLEKECERWTARVKELEERLRIISTVANGSAVR